MAEADTKELAESAKKYWSAEGYTEGGIIREVDYASQSGGLHPSLAGIKIVDTDGNVAPRGVTGASWWSATSCTCTRPGRSSPSWPARSAPRW